MTREEYNKFKLDLMHKHALELNELAKKYCLENNTYKVGDIFTDHNGSIKIEKIKYSSSDLCCVYEGVELKKDLKPVKRGTVRLAWQSNDINK